MDRSRETPPYKLKTIGDAVGALRKLVPQPIWEQEFADETWRAIEERSALSLNDLTIQRFSTGTLCFSLRKFIAAYAVNHVAQRLLRQAGMMPDDLRRDLAAASRATRQIMVKLGVLTEMEVRGVLPDESECKLLRDTAECLVNFVERELCVSVETVDANQPFVRLS